MQNHQNDTILFELVYAYAFCSYQNGGNTTYTN